ncbi:MAG: PX domain-containing protein [Planctomycetota bacterium]
MSISGLAITLTPEADLAETAVAALRERPGIELGPRAGDRLAITAETASARADRELWHWITALPGVVQADVVSVWFDDAAAPGRSHRGTSS